MTIEEKELRDEERQFVFGKHFISKTELNKWRIEDEIGEFKMIPKNILLIDYQYQREGIKNRRILDYARDWSWIACGCLIIVEREEKYYIIDGQHRKLAADKRSDIKDLPCLVFKQSNNINKEAAAFISINTKRNFVCSYDKFKALLVQGDSIACGVNDLIRSTGHRPGKHATGTIVACLASLMKNYMKNSIVAKRIWPLCVNIHSGDPIIGHLLDGLFYIEDNIDEIDRSLLDKYESEKLLDAGKEKIMDHINKARHYYNKGGAHIYAKGILNLLNHRRKEINKLKLQSKIKKGKN